MILVDTSVWIDHLHAADQDLVRLLGDDEVGSHQYVIQELALASIKDRDQVLGLLHHLHRFTVLSHEEAMALVEAHRLWGRGLSAVDAHLLGAVLVTEGARLWTRDKRLHAAAEIVGISCVSP